MGATDALSPSSENDKWNFQDFLILGSSLFAHHFFKAVPFFLCGNLSSPTKKSSSEVPERRGFGEDNCLGRGRADREQKKEKKMYYASWGPILLETPRNPDN